MIHRQTLISLHVSLASFFFPFLLLMPLSGGLDLVDQSGDQEKSSAFVFSEEVPSDPRQRETFFREQFRKNKIDFDFEYIRHSGKDFIFSPSSRVHYVAAQTAEGTNVSRVNPSLVKRMLEIHKGHGPKFIRWIEIAFAIALILVTFSGIWLALSLQVYRKKVGIAFAIGSILIIAALV